MTKSAREEYVSDLREELELRGVPSEAAAQLAAEVDSHSLDSGEDPTVEFGSPAEYANNFAPRSHLLRWVLISVALNTAGGYILIAGVIALQTSAASLWGLPPTSLVILGALLIVAWAITIGTLAARSRRREREWHA